MHVSITQPRTVEQAWHNLTGASTGFDTPISAKITADDTLTKAFTRGSRRPEWVWVAERAERIVSRVAAYGGPDNDHPWLIDLVDLGAEPDRVDIAAALLQRAVDDLTARGATSIELDVWPPSHWRDDAPKALTDLLDASASAGFEILVTRRRFRWTPADGLPVDDGALRYEHVAGVDDPALIDAYRRTFAGSLDAHTQRSLHTTDADELAAQEVADMGSYAGPVDGWRLAFNRAGDLVGLVTGTPGTEALIGYVGVVAEQRGHGHARRLLAWMTRWQADQGAQTVVGETDDQNTPMAAAFEAVGYVQESARIDLVHTS